MEKFNELVESVMNEKSSKITREDMELIEELLEEQGQFTAYVPNGQDFIVIKSKKYKMSPEEWVRMVEDMDIEWGKKTGGRLELNSPIENYKDNYIQIRVK